MEERTENLMTWIEDTFEGASLQDLHQGYIHYQIKDGALTWANLFGTLERAKKQYYIEDYSVSQTTPRTSLYKLCPFTKITNRGKRKLRGSVYGTDAMLLSM